MRVFVAVEISNAEILNKIQTFQEELLIEAKPTRIDQIHFTLKFLGEIDELKCAEVRDVLKTIAFSQFDLSLKGVGAFPSLKNPRVIWVGCDEKGAEKLSEIAKEIADKLSALGFEKDKKFKPHLTILRVKHKIGDITTQISKHAQIDFGSQIISKIKLKRSVLSPKGPEYSDLLEVNGNEN